jgi:hypothetical protein
MARLTRSFPPGPLAATPAVGGGVPLPPRHRASERPRSRRAALAAAVLLAVAVAHLAGDDAASARAAAADPELTRLLRAMAFTKAAMAAGAVWLADRLLRRPLARRACRHRRPALPRRHRPAAGPRLAADRELAFGSEAPRGRRALRPPRRRAPTRQPTPAACIGTR